MLFPTLPRPTREFETDTALIVQSDLARQSLNPTRRPTDLDLIPQHHTSFPESFPAWLLWCIQLTFTLTDLCIPDESHHVSLRPFSALVPSTPPSRRRPRPRRVDRLLLPQRQIVKRHCSLLQ